MNATEPQTPRIEIQIGQWKGWATTARGRGQLAPRQLRYLLRVANGETQSNAARSEGIKRSTMTKAMATIFYRLELPSGNATAAAAVAQAIRKGIITPLLILLSLLGPMLADDELRRQKGGKRNPGNAKITARMMVKTRPPELLI